MAVDLGSVRTVSSFHILLVIIFHYFCWRSFACTQERGSFLALPHPTIIGPIKSIGATSLGGNVSKKGPKNVRHNLMTFGGRFSWRRGGLTRLMRGDRASQNGNASQSSK
jgi:hypothetical protein